MGRNPLEGPSYREASPAFGAMFGLSSKPLHKPEPKHHDRRAGPITEAYRSALLTPLETPPPTDARSMQERRRSREKLAARRPLHAGDLDVTPFLAIALILLTYWLAASVLG